jgi:hypothetical protein
VPVTEVQPTFPEFWNLPERRGRSFPLQLPFQRRSALSLRVISLGASKTKIFVGKLDGELWASERTICELPFRRDFGQGGARGFLGSSVGTSRCPDKRTDVNRAVAWRSRACVESYLLRPLDCLLFVSCLSQRPNTSFNSELRFMMLPSCEPSLAHGLVHQKVSGNE